MIFQSCAYQVTTFVKLFDQVASHDVFQYIVDENKRKSNVFEQSWKVLLFGFLILVCPIQKQFKHDFYVRHLRSSDEKYVLSSPKLRLVYSGNAETFTMFCRKKQFITSLMLLQGCFDIKSRNQKQFVVSITFSV